MKKQLFLYYIKGRSKYILLVNLNLIKRRVHLKFKYRMHTLVVLQS